MCKSLRPPHKTQNFRSQAVYCIIFNIWLRHSVASSLFPVFMSDIVAARSAVVLISCVLLIFTSCLLLSEMGKKPSLSEIQHAQIVILYKEGQSERKISEKLGVSKRAVYQAVVKFKNSGQYSDQKRSGRPRKTTLRDDHLIRRIAVRSPMSSSCRKIWSALLHKVPFVVQIVSFCTDSLESKQRFCEWDGHLARLFFGGVHSSSGQSTALNF